MSVRQKLEQVPKVVAIRRGGVRAATRVKYMPKKPRHDINFATVVIDHRHRRHNTLLTCQINSHDSTPSQLHQTPAATLLVHIRQDTPGAVARLTEAIRYRYVDHAVAQLKAEQVEQAAIDAAITVRVAELSAAGVTVLTEDPHSREPGSAAREVDELAPADDPMRTFSIVGHARCPGHAIWVAGGDYYPADPDAEQVAEVVLFEVVVCTDWAAHGHISHLYADRHSTTQESGGGEPVDEDAARAAAEAEADAAAEVKREAHRTLLRRNREGLAAQTVRREFLRQSMSVKSRHKKMAAWALSRVVLRDSTHRNWQGPSRHSTSVLGELLGVERADREIRDAAPVRHPLLLWAQVVSAYEEGYPKDAHRDRDTDRAGYLAHLVDLGYTLAEVEQCVIDITTLANASAAASDIEPDDEENADGETPIGGDAGPGESEAGDEDQEVTAA